MTNNEQPESGLANSKPVDSNPEPLSKDGGSSSPQKSKASWVRCLISLFVFSLILLFGYLGVQAPAVPEAEVPLEDFSAKRAHAALAKFLGDQQPRPMGSMAHRIAGDRLFQQMAELGHKPRWQEGLVLDETHKTKSRAKSSRPKQKPSTKQTSDDAKAKNSKSASKSKAKQKAISRYERIAWARNLIVEIEPSQPDPAYNNSAFAVVAHYDSVAAGPGAADDGYGVATLLELARYLRDHPPLKRKIVLLATDGEEQGLFGAQLFLRKDSLARQIKWVVNLEARGNQGPALLFELSRGSNSLIHFLKSGAVGGNTSSLFAEIYKSMPNDTDFTHLQAAGWRGYNFANIGRIQHYHSPHDDLEHFDLRSLQSHGRQTLALLKSFAKGSEPDSSKEEAVFFDIAGRWIVVYSANFSSILAFCSFLILLLVAVNLPSVQKLSRAKQLKIAICSFTPFVLCLIAGYGYLLAAQSMGALASPWSSSSGLWLVSFFFLAFLLNLIAHQYLLKGVDSCYRFFAVWIPLSALAFALTMFSPPLSYPLVLPVAGAAIAALIALLFMRSKHHDGWEFLSLMPVAMGLIIWFPLALLIYDALGIATGLESSLSCAGLFLVSSASFPNAAQPLRRLSFTSLLLLLLSSGLALAMGDYSESKPGDCNFQYIYETHEKTGKWRARSWSAPLHRQLNKIVKQSKLPTEELQGVEVELLNRKQNANEEYELELKLKAPAEVLVYLLQLQNLRKTRVKVYSPNQETSGSGLFVENCRQIGFFGFGNEIHVSLFFEGEEEYQLGCRELRTTVPAKGLKLLKERAMGSEELDYGLDCLLPHGNGNYSILYYLWEF